MLRYLKFQSMYISYNSKNNVYQNDQNAKTKCMGKLSKDLGKILKQVKNLNQDTCSNNLFTSDFGNKYLNCPKWLIGKIKSFRS